MHNTKLAPDVQMRRLVVAAHLPALSGKNNSLKLNANSSVLLAGAPVDLCFSSTTRQVLRWIP